MSDIERLENVIFKLERLEVESKNICNYFDREVDRRPVIEKGEYINYYNDENYDYYRSYTDDEDFETYTFEELMVYLRQYFNNSTAKSLDELGFLYTSTETDYSCNDIGIMIRKTEWTDGSYKWQIFEKVTKEFNDVEELIQYLQDKYN